MTMQEQLLKAEHDAWLANYVAEKNTAMLEYIAICDHPEILEEEEDENNAERF